MLFSSGFLIKYKQIRHLMDTFVPFHQHLLIKGYFQNPPRETSVLDQWFIDLVHKVKMEVVGGPTCVYVDAPGNEGLTGTVTLATSHASIHIWDAEHPYMFQFDIYSCKCFELDEIKEHLDVFGLIGGQWMMIDRNDGLSLTSQGRL
jgi:S-adenosylmethionine/arginine decarboxylase-like enzyme